MTTQTAVFHPANQRGHVAMDWLNSHHSFSFGQYYNPEMISFGVLRVINDDEIAPSNGFGMHPHRDMEIITIPIQGRVHHRDSLGTSGSVGVNEVQVMSAGTGILHSEMNPSDEVALKLFQIWIIPREGGVKPRYDQMNYELVDNQLRWLVAPVPEYQGQKTMRINQDAHIGMARMQPGHELTLSAPISNQGTYVFVVEGNIEVNGKQLQARDAFGHWEQATTLKASADSQVIVFHVPA